MCSSDLKILPEKVLHSPQAIQRFFQEICILNSLSHENIVRLHYIGVCKETVFIVMEYVAGYDLERLLKKEMLGETQALGFLIPILEALEHAHSLKIVHRDLKPANILIEEVTKKPKIADFGIAKLTSEETAEDNAFGTPAYMAPEQIVSGKDIDIRADLYAVGSIFYHMLCGNRPYYHIENPQLLLKAKMQEEPQDIEEIAPELHDKVKVMVRQAISRDVKSRYQTPAEFLKDARTTLEEIKRAKASYRGAPPEVKSKAPTFNPNNEEILMTATRYEVDNVLQTFQKEVETFNKTFVGSILAEESKEGKMEFEETLLSITKMAEAALKISAEEQKLISKSFSKDMLHTVLNLLKIDKLTPPQKKVLGELKYLLLLRGNSLAKRSTLLEIINEGSNFLSKKLDELCHITQSPAFNKEIRKYFDQLIGSLLKKYDQVFVEEIKACQDYDEFECYLNNYTLNSLTTLKNYKNLQLISKVKEMKEKIDESPQSLAKILDKYLGKVPTPLHSAVKKIHATREEENSLWRMIGRTVDINELLTHLVRFEQKKEFQSISSRMRKIIDAFIGVGGQWSLEQLKTGLNFIPQRECNKVCQLMRKKLKEELEQKIQELLKFEGNEHKRFNALMNLLRNPRYHQKIVLYGYDVKDLAAKLPELRSQPDDVQLSALREKLPQQLISLVYDDKNLEISSHSKTLGNCLEKLNSLEKQLCQGSQSPLVKVLVGLFKGFGKINFAKEDSIYAVDGYEVARCIVRYYNEHGKEALELPENLREEISQKIVKLIEMEKQRQSRHGK